ncbi:MAG: hypothetical protein LLF97_06250 [Planctomycetaceae bacterium]|nr:hypothetical protein [Planctomycetaceae bacterium]
MDRQHDHGQYVQRFDHQHQTPQLNISCLLWCGAAVGARSFFVARRRRSRRTLKKTRRGRDRFSRRPFPGVFFVRFRTAKDSHHQAGFSGYFFSAAAGFAASPSVFVAAFVSPPVAEAAGCLSAGALSDFVGWQPTAQNSPKLTTTANANNFFMIHLFSELIHVAF